eukprot:1783813-Prymnesium_polylepis.1
MSCSVWLGIFESSCSRSIALEALAIWSGGIKRADTTGLLIGARLEADFTATLGTGALGDGVSVVRQRVVFTAYCYWPRCVVGADPPVK